MLRHSLIAFTAELSRDVVKALSRNSGSELEGSLDRAGPEGRMSVHDRCLTVNQVKWSY